METRANYVVIGLFTLAVIAGGFGFVYWFSRAGDGTERAIYRVVFDGSRAWAAGAPPDPERLIVDCSSCSSSARLSRFMWP